MFIRIHKKRTLGRAIEWADKAKTQPICHILKCPYCRKEQWVRKKQLYLAHNNTKNNHRCKHCGLGNAKKRLHGDEPYDTASEDGFSPKSPGWRSIYHTLVNLSE